MRLGYENGNMFESSRISGQKILTTINSHGIDFSAVTFYNDNPIGFFVADSFLFISSMSISSAGQVVELDVDSLDFAFQIQIILGPGFRSKITDDLDFIGGLGLSVTQLSLLGDRNFQMYSFGIGGEVCLTLDLTDNIYINFGSKLGADFYQIDAQNGNSAFGLNTFKINPFVSIGFVRSIEFAMY